MTNIRFIIVTSLSFFLFLTFNILSVQNAAAEDVLLSKEDFLKIAFDEIPRRKGLRFKGEVKEVAQYIMGSNYKKIRIYQENNNSYIESY